MATSSPVLSEQTLTFPQAMEAVLHGNAITKNEWSDPAVFAELRDNFLMLRRDGRWHTWTISRGDMIGTDYRIL